MLRPLLILMALAGISLPGSGQTTPGNPAHHLARLIGSWDVADVYHSADGREYRETGVRTCGLVLHDRYVECLTKARSASGRDREYRWWWSWNEASRRFELLSIFSNVPLQLRQTVHIDSTGSVWNIRTPPDSDDGAEYWLGAELRFEDNDRAVWTGYRNVSSTSITSWVESSREVWIRRAP